MKKKKKPIELLPPPPPFPTIEIENKHEPVKEIVSKPVITKKIISESKIKRNEEIVAQHEEKEFSDLNLDKKSHSIDFPDLIQEDKKASKHIEEAKAEIKEAAANLDKSEKKSFFSKISRSKEEPIKNPVQNNTDLLLTQVQKGKDFLDKKDIEGAKKMYIDIMKLYSVLSNEDKKKVYGEVTKFYYDRKQLEDQK